MEAVHGHARHRPAAPSVAQPLRDLRSPPGQGVVQPRLALPAHLQQPAQRQPHRPDAETGRHAPGLLRLPGGNYLEGDTIAEHFDWKKTLGDISLRPATAAAGTILPPTAWDCSNISSGAKTCTWSPFWRSTPAIRSAASTSAPASPRTVRGRGPRRNRVRHRRPEHRLGRAPRQDGHPEPFKLRYVEIGNEDKFDRSRSYDGRFAQFYDAIKAKYPAPPTHRHHARQDPPPRRYRRPLLPLGPRHGATRTTMTSTTAAARRFSSASGPAPRAAPPRPCRRRWAMRPG